MKERENSLFLLEAIGELSEDTIAEAGRPAVFPLRLRITIAASVLAAAFISAFFAAALAVDDTPKEPLQTIYAENHGGAYGDHPSSPDQEGEIAVPLPASESTEEINDPEPQTESIPDEEPDAYYDSQGSGGDPDADSFPSLNALLYDVWERDQEYIRKWNAEHPGTSSHSVLDGVTGDTPGQESTLPDVQWDPNGG